MSKQPKNPVVFDTTIQLEDGWTLRKYPISGEWALHDETGAHVHWMTTRAAKIVEATYAAGLIQGAQMASERTVSFKDSEPRLPKLKGCRACFGSGGKRNDPCQVCQGLGKVSG